MRKIIVVISILLASINSFSQDQIILNDSSRIDCKILYTSNNQIQFENFRTLSTEIVSIDTIQGYIYQGNIYLNSTNKDKLLFKPYSYHSAKNTIYSELLGSTLSYSINYDRIIFQKRKLKSSLVIGGALLYRYEIFYPCFKIGNILFIGNRNNHFEIGVGITYLEQVTDSYKYGIEHTKALILDARIGYRYKKPDGGFFFNIAFVPLVALTVFDDVYDDYGNSRYEGIQPFGAFGFGYTIKEKTATIKGY